MDRYGLPATFRFILWMVPCSKKPQGLLFVDVVLQAINHFVMGVIARLVLMAKKF